jgi:hypothetical protein
MSIFDLAPAIAAFATDSISVHRFDADTFGAGGFANAQTSTVTQVANCCVQPGTGKVKVTMPEGVRPSDVITVYAPFDFQPTDRIVITTGVFAVQFGGHLFEVFEVAEFGGLGNYSKAFARALGADEPRA